jgi:hypothetical protein
VPELVGSSHASQQFAIKFVEFNEQHLVSLASFHAS